MSSPFQRRVVRVTFLAVLLCVGSLWGGGGAWLAIPALAAQPASLPTSLTDAEFWKLSTDISEPGGYFQSDNFTSNEMGYPQIIVDLQATGHHGGVYMGVGPEQNFSYITAIRPQMVFIVDIRRQAIIQHLMYKAIFDLSADRADFVSRLFSRPRPAGLDTNSTIQQIWNAYAAVPGDSVTFTKNLAAIKNQLMKVHGFPLDTADLQSLDYVYGAFYWLGPTITYGGYGGQGGRGGGNGGNFATLSTAVDDNGTPRSFLGTEDNFRYMKGMHAKNLIMLATGDFGGPKALRAVGQYIRDHGGTVTAFYVSNVEQYLFQNNVWHEFYDNVATLPIDANTVFIRPGNNNRMNTVPTCPIAAYLAAYKAGRIYGYTDATGCTR